jgi:hypothetical protein
VNPAAQLALIVAAWYAAALILGPLVGWWLRRQQRHYPAPAASPVDPAWGSAGAETPPATRDDAASEVDGA